MFFVKIFLICFFKIFWSFIVALFYFDFKETSAAVIKLNLLFALAFVTFLEFFLLHWYLATDFGKIEMTVKRIEKNKKCPSTVKDLYCTRRCRGDCKTRH